MDVESLAKQLILQNMTPEQQKAVLESVRATLQDARGKQKQRVSENVGMVVDALKKIEADIRAKYDDLGNKITTRVNSIRDGRDGANGSDGRDGLDGRPGRDGAQGPAGPAGRDGVNGIDGVDGVSVTDAKIDFDGSLIISLSNGREINVGEVVAPDVAEKIRIVANGGGTSQTVIDALASLQTQIDNLIPSQTGNAGKFLTTNGSALSWSSVAGGLSYQGTWNASTNTPTLTSSVGVNGYYYIVATAGSTNLNGITDWQIGDWLMFNGSVWQKIDQSNLVTSVNGQTGAVVLDAADVGALDTITSVDGSVTISTTGTTADLSVAVAGATTNVICLVRNTTGATLTKGTAVYISGSTGQNPTVSKAQANNDANSAQTLGLMSADLANNSNGYVTIIGLITNVNTSAYTDGQQLYLSPTTAGALTTTKPYAPEHLVYVAVVERAHPTQGKLFVKVQNGYELDELHNVSAQSPSNGQVLIYNASTSLWEKNTLTDGTGITITEGAGSITITNSAPDQTVALTGAGTTSITGTYPNFTITSNDQYAGTVTSVGGTGTVNGISLSGTVTSSGNLTLGGTLSGVSLSTQVTGTLPIANGGTGQTTAVAAFDALSPTTTKGDLIVNNGSDNVRLAVGTNNYVLTADSSQATGVKWATVAAGTTVSDDTTTNAIYYPTFSTATSGTYSVATVSSTKLTYNPSLGDLTATQLAASNGIMFTNQTVSTSVTFPTGYEGISGKNTTIASGVTVTVPSGANWTIV